MHNPQWAEDHSMKPAVSLQIKKFSLGLISHSWFSFSHEHWSSISTRAPLLGVLVTGLDPYPGEASHKGSSWKDEPTFPGLNSSDFSSVSYIWLFPLALPFGGQCSDPTDNFWSLLCNFSLALDNPSWHFFPLLASEPLLSPKFPLWLLFLLSLFWAHT